MRETESGSADVPDDILDLAYRVENLLGVYDAGFWSADRLMAELRMDPMVRTVITPSPVTTTNAPVSTVFEEPSENLRPVMDAGTTSRALVGEARVGTGVLTRDWRVLTGRSRTKGLLPTTGRNPPPFAPHPAAHSLEYAS